MFQIRTGSWNPAGRSMGWRVAMALFGLFTCGLGVVIIIWPNLVAYAIGGVMVLFGLMFLSAALAARSRTRQDAAWTPPDGDAGPVHVVVETETVDD